MPLYLYSAAEHQQMVMEIMDHPLLVITRSAPYDDRFYSHIFKWQTLVLIMDFRNDCRSFTDRCVLPPPYLERKHQNLSLIQQQLI